MPLHTPQPGDHAEIACRVVQVHRNRTATVVIGRRHALVRWDDLRPEPHDCIDVTPPTATGKHHGGHSRAPHFIHHLLHAIAKMR